MDGDASGGPAAHVWRMCMSRRAVFFILIIFGLGVAILAGPGIYYGQYALGVAVIIGGAGLVTWSALQLRSSLTVTDNVLIVRTAWQTYKIPCQQITRVDAGTNGIYITTSDGRRITSQVAADSDWSRRFGLKTKATVMVDAINNAIRTNSTEAAAATESAEPDHVPAVTGEAAAPSGRAAAARLVKTTRISVLMIMIGVACLIGSFAAIAVLTGSSAALLAHGTRVPGTVADLGNAHMDVRFVRNGKPTMARINLTDSSPNYRTGEHVTVVYDPARPDRVRTTQEENEGTGSTLGTVVLLVAGALLLIGGVSNLFRVARQRAD